MTVAAVPASLADAVRQARAEVSALHAELLRWGLVTWTAGNVSARVRGPQAGADLVVIKPSGLGYDELTPEVMVVTDLAGTVIEGDLAPSSDTLSHLYIYREMPRVGGRGPHPQSLRHRMGGPARADPVRHHGNG